MAAAAAACLARRAVWLAVLAVLAAVLVQVQDDHTVWRGSPTAPAAARLARAGAPPPKAEEPPAGAPRQAEKPADAPRKAEEAAAPAGQAGKGPQEAEREEKDKKRAAQDALAEAVRDALLEERAAAAAERAPCSGGVEVVVGFNGNLDLVVRADRLARALLASGAMRAEELAEPYRADEAVRSPGALFRAIGHYLRLGAAVERFGRDRELFDSLTEAAEAAGGAEFLIGGNAAIMSQRLATLGCRVAFAAPTGPRLRELQHGLVEGAPSLASARDDVHLILEYGRGRFLAGVPETEGWKAGRANRFIFTRHSDLERPDQAVRRVVESRGRVPHVVLSGFHLLDGQPSEGRDALLDGVAALLRGLAPGAVTHVEVASMAETALLRGLARGVLGAARSAGANEQELAALADVLRGGEIRGEGYASQPSVDEALATVAEVMRGTGLQRFHLHSLAFQAVCVAAGSGFPSPRQSAVESSLTATTQACGAGEARALHADELRVLFPASFRLAPGAPERAFDPRAPVVCGEPAGGVECCVAPVLVCRNPLRTVGLGDHISAAGLSVYF